VISDRARGARIVKSQVAMASNSKMEKDEPIPGADTPEQSPSVVNIPEAKDADNKNDQDGDTGGAYMVCLHTMKHRSPRPSVC